jgi:DNA-3-methyladenine glycosylase II
MRVITRELRPAAPYDFSLALAYLRTWTASTFERVDGDTYRRALRIDGQDVLLVARSAGSVAQPALALDVHGDRVTGATADRAARVVGRVFALDHDPAAFHALAASDPVLAPFADACRAMRPVTIPELYETLIWAVLGQQINVAFARALKLRLVELCGRTLTVDGATYPLMPRPDDVAVLDPAALLARQYSRQKARYVVELSQAVAGGELDLEALRVLPPEDAIAELTRFRGIGRWTAEYVLMRGLGHPDAIPAGDVSLQLLIGTACLGRRAGEAEVREIAARWAPWRGWAAFFIWMERQMGRGIGIGDQGRGTMIAEQAGREHPTIPDP